MPTDYNCFAVKNQHSEGEASWIQHPPQWWISSAGLGANFCHASSCIEHARSAINKRGSPASCQIILVPSSTTVVDTSTSVIIYSLHLLLYTHCGIYCASDILAERTRRYSRVAVVRVIAATSLEFVCYVNWHE